MVFGKKTQGFIERPRLIVHIRKELIAHYLGILPKTVQEKMGRLGLSLQSLDDCITYIRLRTKKKS